MQKKIKNVKNASTISPTVTPRMIVSCVFGLCVFAFVTVVLYPLFGGNRFSPTQIASEPRENITTSFIDIKSFEIYAGAIGGRQLFKAPSFQNRGQSRQDAGESLITVEDPLQDLVIVGILAGDVPQAVIEDKKANKTYTLSAGQAIRSMTITEIRDGKVLLNTNGHTLELTL